MKKLISIILITTFSFSLFPSMSNFVAASTETREKVDEVYGGPRKSKKSKVGKALAGIAGVAGGAAFAAKKLSSVANNGSLLKNSTNGLNGTGITPNPANVTTSYPVDVEKGNDQANASKNNEIVNDSVVNGTDSAVSNSANVTTSYTVDVEKGNGQANVDQSNETGSNITNQEETDGSSQVTPYAINVSDGTGEEVDPNNPEEGRNSTDTEVESDENDPKTEEQPDDLKNQKGSINALSSALSSLSNTGERNSGSGGSIFSAGSLTPLQLPTTQNEESNDDSQKLKNLPNLKDLISDEKSNFANTTINKCCDDRSSVCLEDCESASGENITSFSSNQEDPAEEPGQDEEQDDEDDTDFVEPAKEQNTNTDEWLNYVKWPGIGLATTYVANELVCFTKTVNNQPWKCIFNPIRWFSAGRQNGGYVDEEEMYGNSYNSESPSILDRILSIFGVNK